MVNQIAYHSILVGENGAKRFLQRHHGKQLGITDAYSNIENAEMRSDSLRYLVLNIGGGVHTDTDTFPVKAIDDRVPIEHRD
jgi:alpha 1,6-mannosyltransferase